MEIFESGIKDSPRLIKSNDTRDTTSPRFPDLGPGRLCRHCGHNLQRFIEEQMREAGQDGALMSFK